MAVQLTCPPACSEQLIRGGGILGSCKSAVNATPLTCNNGTEFFAGFLLSCTPTAGAVWKAGVGDSCAIVGSCYPDAAASAGRLSHTATSLTVLDGQLLVAGRMSRSWLST
jgi:hypothetical protein